MVTLIRRADCPLHVQEIVKMSSFKLQHVPLFVKTRDMKSVIKQFLVILYSHCGGQIILMV